MIISFIHHQIFALSWSLTYTKRIKCVKKYTFDISLSEHWLIPFLMCSFRIFFVWCCLLYTIEYLCMIKNIQRHYFLILLNRNYFVCLWKLLWGWSEEPWIDILSIKWLEAIDNLLTLVVRFKNGFGKFNGNFRGFPSKKWINEVKLTILRLLSLGVCALVRLAATLSATVSMTWTDPKKSTNFYHKTLRKMRSNLKTLISSFKITFFAIPKVFPCTHKKGFHFCQITPQL
jgi:hypothetical protein